MKKLIVAALLLTSCASFKDTTNSVLDHADDAAVVAREVGYPLFDKRCGEFAVACREDNDQVCQPLKDCHEAMEVFDTILKSVHFLVVDTRSALDVYDDEEPILERVAKILALLEQIRSHLVALGVKL